MASWRVIKKGKSHAELMIDFEHSRVEFWCGRIRYFKETRFPTTKDNQCQECIAYLRNAEKRG